MQRTPAEHAVSMGSSSGPSQPSAGAAGPDLATPAHATPHLNLLVYHQSLSCQFWALCMVAWPFYPLTDKQACGLFSSCPHVKDCCAVEQPVFSAQKAKILFHEGASPYEAMQPSNRRAPNRAPTSEHALTAQCTAERMTCMYSFELSVNCFTSFIRYVAILLMMPDAALVSDHINQVLMTVLSGMSDTAHESDTVTDGRGRENGAEEACA